MNSYNENLNSVVVTSLQSQSLDEKSIFSKLNASMFTLYYAEGAVITAEEKLIEDSIDLQTKKEVMQQAVKNTNLSNNLLASSTQANQYYKQSINNMAVCAANVQVATNAIVRLASDIGSIFSIVYAADRNSEIFNDTSKVRALIDSTAHAAELASKLAMETSTYTSEVSIPTVLDKSKSANIAIKNLLQITTTDFNNVSSAVSADNVNLATLSAKEKLAEGVLEDISIDFKATKSAYNSTNKELNLNLWVSKAENSDNLYNFSFNQIDNPFDHIETVHDYHLIFVKDSKKATFSMSNAANIRENPNKFQYIEVNGPDVNGVYEKSIDLLHFFSISDIASPSPVLDSDGEKITLGINYVVFVYAVYTDPYKREINNFDDFLSAPSRQFMVTSTLPAVKADTMDVGLVYKEDKSEEDINIEVDFKFNQNQVLKTDFDFTDQILNISEYTHKLTFNTPEVLPIKHEYRCIFLPKRTGSGMLTSRALKVLLKESIGGIEKAEKMIIELGIQIVQWTEETKDNNDKQTVIKQRLKAITAQLTENLAEKELKSLRAEESLLQKELLLLVSNHDLLKKQISNAETQIVNLEKHSFGETQDDLGFYFDLTMAEQVSGSNYTIAGLDNSIKTDDHTKAGKKKVTDDKDNVEKPPKINWMAYIGTETTDNFGNLLIDQSYYYPVILTISKAGTTLPERYTNAYVTAHKPFKFNAKNTKIATNGNSN